MNVTTLGIDLAKNTFSLHGVDAHGKSVLRKILGRAKLMPFFAQQSARLIGMEACSGFHHRAFAASRLSTELRFMKTNPSLYPTFCVGLA